MEVKTLGLPLAPAVDWDIFEGEVHAAEVVDASEARDVRVWDVTFRPGARTTVHSHTVDQILYIVSGHGFVQTEGQAPRAVFAVGGAGAQAISAARKPSVASPTKVGRPARARWRGSMGKV